MCASAIVAAMLVSASGAPREFAVLPGSTLAYHLVHRFHAVDGVSRAVEGRARILPDGTLQVMVRAPLASFDSGDANRDSNMREVTGAAQNPFVTFKGVGRVELPDAYPSELEVPLRGELTLKTTRPTTVTIAVRFEAPDRARARATFPVSLGEHDVERPSLLLVKVNDRVDVSASLELGAVPER